MLMEACVLLHACSAMCCCCVGPKLGGSMTWCASQLQIQQDLCLHWRQSLQVLRVGHIYALPKASLSEQCSVVFDMHLAQ